MPELPEVETVRRGLAPVLIGRRLAKVEIARADLRFPFPDRFSERLRGASVRDVGRRAKYLLAPLDTGETLVCHLGMSGRYSIVGAAAQPGALYYSSPPDAAHTHVVFETDRGDRIEYNDPRRFGYMDLIPTGQIDAHPWFAGLGPEPNGNAFSAAHLAQVFDGRTQNVKATLLDQRIVAGLGNIYVCEALFRAGISPKRAAGAISRQKLDRLADAVRAVIAEAIEAGGSSLRDYAAADGALGYFQHRFRVYDREGEACMQCGRPVLRIVQGGRSSFYCGKCQR